MRLTVITCLLLSISSAFAATDAGKSQELKEVQSRIQKVGNDVRSLAVEKGEHLDQLKKFEKRYGELVNAVNVLKSQIAQHEHSLQEIRVKIANTQKELRTQQQGLEGLIKSVAAMGDKDKIGIFMSPNDPTLSSRMQVYYDYISKARLQKLQAIEENAQELRQFEAEKDAQTQLIQQTLHKKQQETEDLQRIKADREKLLAEINGQFADKQEQLQRLEQNARKLESLLASLPKSDDNVVHATASAPEPVATPAQAAPAAENSQNHKRQEAEFPVSAQSQTFEALKGKLSLPVQGGISERFGSKRYEMSWDGVVINAHEGADVRAIADGKVVYADWLRGYGLMVIVDHGKGYISLYAFNQSINKSAGSHVKAGESLATVGRSGGRSGPGLYFGIRHRGTPLNPEHWCHAR